MVTFPEVLMNLYVVILGIYLTSTLIVREKDVDGKYYHWFPYLKHNYDGGKPHFAYSFFLLFFIINIIFLYLAYIWFIEGVNVSGYVLRCILILFIPIMIATLFRIPINYFLKGEKPKWWYILLFAVAVLIHPFIIV